MRPYTKFPFARWLFAKSETGAYFSGDIVDVADAELPVSVERAVGFDEGSVLRSEVVGMDGVADDEEITVAIFLKFVAERDTEAA